MWRKFVSWVQGLFRSNDLYGYKYVQDIPDKLKSKTVYLIENQGLVWQCILLCPCGCSAKLYTNLIEDFDPYWKYFTKGKVISLKPSIDRFVGCKSHFFLTDGKIRWC